jgi:Rrf2 family transcriptional regulator, nitric oxide-sensitive transcriptional repressor
MFSSTVEYGLRAMTHLAANAPASLTTADIAKGIRAPSAYLAKVFQDLRQAGLITSRRGIGGGITLARPAKKITLLEIVEATDTLKRPKATATVLAPLNKKVDGMVDQLRQSLAATSLADVAVKTKRDR